MQPVHLAGYFVFAPVELDVTHSWLVTEAILYDNIIMCPLQTTLMKLLTPNNRDVSRVRPRTHSFFFWTQRILNEGSNWMQKKIECLCKLQTPGKNSVTQYANLCFVKTIFIN